MYLESLSSFYTVFVTEFLRKNCTIFVGFCSHKTWLFEVITSKIILLSKNAKNLQIEFSILI